MKLKSLVVALVALVVSTSSLIAQQRGGNGQMDCNEMAKRRTETLKKEVKLDEKQEKSAYEVYLNSCKKAQQARKDQNREAAMKIRKQTSQSIDSILTTDQQKLWKLYQEKRAKENPRGGNRPR